MVQDKKSAFFPNSMTLSSDTAKAFDIKVLWKIRIAGNFLNLLKCICKRLELSLCLMFCCCCFKENRNAFLLRPGRVVSIIFILKIHILLIWKAEWPRWRGREWKDERLKEQKEDRKIFQLLAYTPDANSSSQDGQGQSQEIHPISLLDPS